MDDGTCYNVLTSLDLLGFRSFVTDRQNIADGWGKSLTQFCHPLVKRWLEIAYLVELTRIKQGENALNVHASGQNER